MENWIQFTMLMLAIIGFAVRNEHRITLLEGTINTERARREALTERVDKLEEKNA